MKNHDADVVWKLFESTGNPVYYCLYERLREK